MKRLQRPKGFPDRKTSIEQSEEIIRVITFQHAIKAMFHETIRYDL